jgi:hypothetical protein
MKDSRGITYGLLLVAVIFGLWGCQGAAQDGIKVPGTKAWTDSGVHVKKGQVIRVQATGELHVNKKIRSGPNGLDDMTLKPITKLVFRGYNITSQAVHGALIGKIGKEGTPFPVGKKGEIKAQASGTLFLGVNDRDLQNNRGHYIARVSVR